MADDRSRRRELAASYKEAAKEAGVYVVRNTVSGKLLIGSTSDMASMRNKVTFARATNSPGALDMRLANDIRALGWDAFEFEVLEVLEVEAGERRDKVRAELATLEGLWRERFVNADMYA